MLPAAGCNNTVFAPDAGCSVEVKKSPGAAARRVLKDEMGIKGNRLHLGKRGVVPVEMPPQGLHHADARV